MATDEEVVGFNPTDANALLALIGGSGGEAISLGARKKPTDYILARTTSGGLAAGAVGSVYVKDPTSTGWTVTTDEIPAWTVGSTIPANTDVLLVPVNGRWLALRIC